MGFLIVGLGNPGKKYEKTRHNLGFNVVDLLAERLKQSFQEKENYLISAGEINNFPLYLLKPLTFMNRSGLAVKNFIKYKNDINERNIFVVYDDLDLPVGKIRLKWNGGSGGHRGVNSIIENLATKNFYHLKIGIDKPPLKELVESYVLGNFSKQEYEFIEVAKERAVECLLTAINESPTKAMNIFNG
ncbi:MAG: aminoacyl-tRNA hydrolase [Proteobacteria bacterium]|nr:aminoacyl-tRNA hydrolase [Pseudomonadota bacterium]